VLAVGLAAHLPVMEDAAVATDDGYRLPSGRGPDLLQGGNQGRDLFLHPIRGQLAAAVAVEFLSAEMGAEVAHIILLARF